MAIDLTQLKAQVIDLATNLTTSEKNNISEAIVRDLQTDASFDSSNVHTIIDNVKHGEIIPILGQKASVDSFPMVTGDACEIPECDLTITGSTHKWELYTQECKIPICMRKFDQEFNIWFGRNNTAFPSDADVNDLAVRYFQDLFLDNLNIAKWRGTYFGDKSLTSNLYNLHNGFFTQMEANATQVIPIISNTGATYAAQLLFTGMDVYNTMVTMYEKYMENSYMSSTPTFKMTKRTAVVLANYLNGLKDKTCCPGVGQVLNPNTIGQVGFAWNNLTFWGLQIQVVPEWDRIITESTPLNNGIKWDNPHRIVLSESSNMLIGVEKRNQLEDFDIWYSQDDNKVYMKGGARLGAGVPLKDKYILSI
jgi:hypothetical protein